MLLAFRQTLTIRQHSSRISCPSKIDFKAKTPVPFDPEIVSIVIDEFKIITESTTEDRAFPGRQPMPALSFPSARTIESEIVIFNTNETASDPDELPRPDPYEPPRALTFDFISATVITNEVPFRA
jgi:hypothetical protein